MKEVSIIIPIYNCEEYLEECFNSIINQSYSSSKIEVILINDGTKDKSTVICQKYSKLYGWIFIDRKINHGIGYTRNEGISKSKGKYILFLDSDDLLYKDTIKELLKNVKKYNSDLVVSKLNSFDSKGYYGYYSDRYLKRELETDIFKTNNLLNCISVCAKLYKRSLIENIKFLEDTIHEDNLFSLSVFLKAKKISIFPKYTYYRRIREGENKSVMQTLSLKTFKNLMKNFEVLIENRKEKKEYFLYRFMLRKLINYIAMNIRKEDSVDCLKETLMLKKQIYANGKISYFRSLLYGICLRIYYLIAIMYKEIMVNVKNFKKM